MKNLYWMIVLSFLFISWSYAADVKITELPETTTVVPADIIPVVTNTDTSPETKKIAVGNFISAQAFTTTAGSPTAIVTGTHGNSAYFWNIGNSAANSIFTLPTAAAGLQYCIRNYTGITKVMKFQTSAAGQYIDLDGVNTATGGLIKSAGAAGDGACVVGVDATHWVSYHSSGTWSKD